MNTQTHLLLAAALFWRPVQGPADEKRRTRWRNAAVLAGAFVPDAGVYGFFVWSKLAGVPEREAWGTLYFAPPMQSVQAVFNSVPLYAVMLFVAWFALSDTGARTVVASGRPSASTIGGSLGANGGQWWRFVDGRSTLGLFALAALLHLAGDLPVHATDAHRHFWPLTDWRFVSPVSYWDPAHGGQWFSWVEGTLGLVCTGAIVVRFRSVAVRALTVLTASAYVLVPLYWRWQLG